MVSVAIVDDQPEAAATLAALVETFSVRAGTTDLIGCTDGVPTSFAVTCFTSASELIGRIIDGYELDIAFIDIVLTEPAPSLNTTDNAPAGADQTGIDLVEQLLAHRPTTQIVYTSGYDTFHTKVYRTPHVAYLAKPFRRDDIAYALTLALAAREHTNDEALCFRLKGSERIVRPAEIRYLESKLHVVHVHTARDTFEVYGRLTALLGELPARFVRCHQSFAVNLDAVTSLGASSLTLIGGEEVPVSRRMRAGVRDALFAHLRIRHAMR